MRRTRTFEQLKPAQRHALDSRRNLAVRAGAGSGKTTVLIERTLQLLARSYDEGSPQELRQFAIVTFTRKAAAEIKSRLADGLTQLASTAESIEEQTYWQQRLEELPRAPIGTIDSLCAGILREYGLLAADALRIEPDFAPLQDQDVGLLQTEAVNRVLNRLLAEPSESPDSAQSAQAEAARWWTISQGLHKLTAHLLTLLNHNVEPETVLAVHAALPAPAERVRQLEACHPGLRKLTESRRAVLACLNEVLEALSLLKSKAATPGQLRDQLGQARTFIARDTRPADCAGLAHLGVLINKTDGAKSKFKGTGGLPECLFKLQDDWFDALQSPPLDSAGELAAFEAADRLVRLLEPVYQEYLALCRQANQYDFTLLARRTRDLLRHSPQARRELHHRYRHVMVDEFQDTNFLQWEIIAWLGGEGPDALLDRDRLFIVGDPQQSIYRFRQADVSVFQHVRERIRETNRANGLGDVHTDYEDCVGSDSASATPQAALEQRLGLMPLKENFRSLHPSPLHLLNQVFTHVFDPLHHGHDLTAFPFETTYQELVAGRDSPLAGQVIYVVPDADEDEPAPEESGSEENDPGGTLAPAQVRAVVRELIALHGQPKLTADPAQRELLTWRDMAVLLPSRTDVLTVLEQEFRDRGVPFVTTKGIGFWQRQEVRDLVSLASWLGDPGDELALFAVLRGPLGQLTDTEILYLSQLGDGRLHRGLQRVRARSVSEDGPEDNLVLPQVWEAFPPARRERIARTAELLDHWRRRVDRMAHADLLQSCLEDSGAYAIYAAEPDGEVMLGNLARLMDEVRAQELGRALGLARLARRLRMMVDESTRTEQVTLATDGDAVQIMTVHAAKGLQFPVVAVMRLERVVGTQGRAELLVREPTSALLPRDAAGLPDYAPGVVAVRIRHPARPREWFKSCHFTALKALDRAQELAEARRLFYVAATRVEERLILAGREPRKKKDGQPSWGGQSWQRWFEEALQITDEHKRAELWEDQQRTMQMQIVRSAEPAESILVQAAPTPLPAVDLHYVHELPQTPILPVTGPAGLEAMRAAWQTDRRQWWLRFRAQLLPHLHSPGLNDEQEVDVGAVVGTLVHRCFQMGLAEGPKTGRKGPGYRDRDDLLRAMATGLLATRGAGEDALDQAPDEPTASAAISAAVAGAKAILQRLDGDPAKAQPIFELLKADGPCEVPFVLRLDRWQITGRFDKLCRMNHQDELVDWKTDADADEHVIIARHEPQMLLYALALWRLGTARLVQDRVSVHLVLLHQLRDVTLQFTLDQLAAYEKKLCGELSEMSAALRADLLDLAEKSVQAS